MIRSGRLTTPLAQFDGLAALAIILVIMLHAHGFPLSPHLFHARIDLVDAVFGVCFALSWYQCFALLHLYDRFATVPSRLLATAKGVLLMMVPLALYFSIAHSGALSFKTFVLAAVALCAYGTLRIFVSVYLVDLLAARDPRRAVIIGSGRRASKAWREIRTRYHGSIELLGFMDNRDPEEMPPDVAGRYLGSVDELSELLLREVVDLVLIAMPNQSCYPLMQQAVAVSESVGVDVVYLEDVYSSSLKRKGVASLNIFSQIAPRQRDYVVRLIAKRAVDLIGSILAIIILSPVLLLIALGVKLTSPGPIFFVQPRYGYRRRIFKMVKFRSMVVDAEKLIESLEHANEATGPIFKMKNDPRVTKFGRFIRRTSLDELPQLFNVLTGRMSLVGPRPMSVRDVSLFSQAALMRRFSVKAGMTGLWQVTGRSDATFDEWMALDRNYIDRWSLLLDLHILFRTISVVFKRSGAM